MNSDFAAALDPPEDEVGALVRRLHETQQRLQELTAGGTDAVIHPEGYSYLLHEAQDSLQRSEARQRELVRTQSSILNTLPADVALIDRDGVIVSVNEGWQRFAADLGLQNATACIGLNYLEICDRIAVDDASARQAVAGVRTVLDGEAEEFSMEYPAWRDGGPRWLRLMVNPIAGDGRTGAVVMHVDVTERKNAEESVRESEQRFRESFEQVAVGMAHVSEDGRLLRINDRLCEILGTRRDELLGSGLSALILDEDRARFEDLHRILFTAGLPFYAVELRLQHRGGTVIWLTLTSSLAYTPSGGARHSITVFEDITAAKRAELRLRRLNRLHTVLSKIGEAAIGFPTKEGLYEAVCRAFVRDGRFPLVLIVEADQPPRVVARGPDARFGALIDRPDFSAALHGVVLRSDRREVCNDFRTAPAAQQWWQGAREHGLRAGAAFPIRCRGSIVGTLIVCADEVEYFNEDELHLVDSAVHGVCLALQAVEHEQERQRAENALRASEASMAEAQAVAKVGSWALDIALRELTWSAEMYRIYELVPRKTAPAYHEAFASIHPEERTEVQEIFERSLLRPDTYTLEHRILLPDDRIRFVEIRWQVFADDAGQAFRAIGTCQDITERKLAQTEVQRTTDLLQAVAAGTTDNVFVKDLQGRYVLFNDAMARLTGKRVEDVLGRDISAIVGGEEARRVMAHDRQVIESGLPITAEESLTVNGVTRTVQATKVPHRDAKGKVIGVIGISRDITERKQAEQRLADQAALIDKARDAIIVRDLEHRVTYWNKSAERLFGWTVEEVLGRNVRELLQHESPLFEEAAQAVLIDGDWVGELYVESKGGRKLIVESRWTLVRDETGQPRSIFVINTDVTERKKLEQQFLRAQRLESIGTLAGGVAHDLNNALTPIIMSINLLSARFPDPESQKLLGIIGASAKHGADMVRQVLSFARGVEGRKTEVQVKHLVDDVKKIAEETFPKHLQVRTTLPDELWTLIGDPTQIHQVLLNLCVNARDAMPGGGTLTLAAENIYLDEHYAGMNPEAKAGPYVLLSVEDSGIGMSAETIERIFDPFFTTKEVGKGTGLGLSSSLAIVKSHGGFMQVYSEPGKGTTFRFGLPARTAKTGRSAVDAASDLPRGNGELILIIDDEASVRQLTQYTLEAYGYQTLLTSNGAEGVAVYASRGADIAVVFTDMMMPEMDGPTAIRILRLMNPKVRILCASGLSGHRNSVQVEDLRDIHFLEKPYTAEALLTMLGQVLASG